jgi:restriction system protein
VVAVGRFDQLRGDADLVPGLAHAAFEHVGNVELLCDLAAQGAASGIVVTSGNFTSDAVEFASGRNVRLIAGPELREMIREARLAQPSAAAVPDRPLVAPSGSTGCPRCGSPMVQRRAKRGVNAGQDFYGCSRYPACQGTLPVTL